MDKTECDVPYLGLGYQHTVRTIDYHNYVLNYKYDITICLPPKCGTTNWQRGMDVLHLLS